MTLLAGLGAEEDLAPSAAALGPAALRLPPIDADDYAKVALSEVDRIDRGPVNAGRFEQFFNRQVHRLVDFLTRQVFDHDDASACGT
jgi:hypothetical protein